MGFIIFTADDYRDANTRKEARKATNEERKPLVDLVAELNGKYIDQLPCPTHPQQVHNLNVCLTDGRMNVLQPGNSVCRCAEMMERIKKISEHEVSMFNNR